MTLAAEKTAQKFVSRKSLLEEIERLRHEIKNKDHEIKNKAAEINYLEELLRVSQRKAFVQSSEKYAGMQNLFNETEEETLDDEGDDSSEEESGDKKNGKKRGTPKRDSLPDHLPRKEVLIEIPEKDRMGCDGKPLKEIGEEVSEHLEIEPAKVTVIRTTRKKYGKCECESCLKTAPLPPRPIPKSIAGAGLLAFIAVSKYVDGLPLHRLESILGRSGIKISRGQMASWMIRVSELLIPLYNLLEEELLASSYLNCDETRVQVLKEDGKAATSQSWMWVRARAGPEAPIVLYDYDPTRSSDVPVRLLEGFSGYLQVDGYSGYGAICESGRVKRVGCWAHCRRKFEEAVRAHKNPNKAKIAKRALKYIKRLSKIEKDCREEGHSFDRMAAIRSEKAKPLLEAIRQWLDEVKDTVPPKTRTGAALSYMDDQWDTLTTYLEDGRLQMTNNFAENVIRPFVVGRKAWLFSSTPKGAHASAMIYSLVITARENGLDVYKYMRHVLREIPSARTIEDYESLLPWSVKSLLDGIQNTLDN